MKIAYIGQPFEYIAHQFQGSSVWLQTIEVIHTLVDQPVEFLVYAARFPDQPPYERKGKVEYRRFSSQLDEIFVKPIKFLEKLFRYPRPKRPFFSSGFHYRSYIHQIAKDLSTQQVDIVTIFNYSQFAPIIRAFNPDVSIVLHMTCDWLTQLDSVMIDQRLENVDLILGCSNHITTQVQTKYPHYADKCKTLYNGVRFEAFHQVDGDSQTGLEDGEKRLLFVGRISPEKGIHTLLQAFDFIAQQDPGVWLDIVGSPGSAPYEFMVLVSNDPHVRDLSRFYVGRMKRSNYIDQLQRLLTPHTRSRVNFIGSFPHREVIRYYQQSDILVNPSLTESFGISLVEAMAAKIPTVVTKVGGMKEIVRDGITGLVVEPDNPDALANALLKLLQSKELRDSMGQAGYDHAVNTFTWQHISDQLWGFYNQITEEKLPEQSSAFPLDSEP
jgi:glycosyltransferase involved in cell wall biosynthesis